MRRNPYGKGMHDANRERLEPWRDSVIAAAMLAWGDRPMLTGPVEVAVTFVFPRLRGHYGTGRNAGTLKDSAPLAHTTRPDLDHLQRAIGDSLKYAGVLADDSLICCWVAAKVFGDLPGVAVEITPL